jgi:hypothetical protein
MSAFLELCTALDFTYAALVRHEPGGDADQVAQVGFQRGDVAGNAVGDIAEGQPVQAVACVHAPSVDPDTAQVYGMELRSR